MGDMETHTSMFEETKKKIVAVLKKNPRGLRTKEIAEKIGYGEVDLALRGILGDLVTEERIRSRTVNISTGIGCPFVVGNYYI